jgi:hypothetical protein
MNEKLYQRVQRSHALYLSSLKYVQRSLEEACLRWQPWHCDLQHECVHPGQDPRGQVVSPVQYFSDEIEEAFAFAVLSGEI